MQTSDDLLLALILVDLKIASRGAVRKALLQLEARESATGTRPPLGQILTQERIISPTDYLALRKLIKASRLQCLGCGREFVVIPARRPGQRRCLKCGRKTPTPILDAAIVKSIGGGTASERIRGRGLAEPLNRQATAGRLGAPPSARGAVSPLSVPSSDRSPAVALAKGLVDERGRSLPDKIGNYDIVGYIATGGMGRIYKARHEGGGEVVALKVLIADATEELIERFRREAEAVARLDHPNVVGVRDIGVDNRHRFFTMEYIDGKPLDQVFDSDPGRKVLVRHISEVARGLDYAHDRGLIHRDVKPQNVLVHTSGKAMLTDFGLARDLGLASLSTSGDIIGTPLYMAPEQISSKYGRVDRRTDVFALGVMLYQFLTRKMPFPARNMGELHQLLLSADPRRPREIDASIDESLEAICLRALEKDPRDRYPTARDFGAALEDWLEGRPSERLNSLQPFSFSTAEAEPEDDRLRPALLAVTVGIPVLLVSLAIFIKATINTRMMQARAAAHSTQREQRAAECGQEITKLELDWQRFVKTMPAAVAERRIHLDGFVTRLVAAATALESLERVPTPLKTQLQDLELTLRRTAAEELKRQDLLAAIRILEPIAQDHQDIEACGLMAQLLLAQGDADRALSHYHRLYRETESLEALVGRGRAHRMSGNPRFAEVDLQQALQATTKISSSIQPLIEEELVLAALDRGDFRRALSLLQGCDAEAREMHHAWGRLELARGNALKAVGHMQEAVRVAPGHFEVLRYRAEARLLSGEFDAAAADLERALQLRPEDLDCQLMRAQLAYFRGDVDAARGALPSNAEQGSRAWAQTRLLELRLDRVEGRFEEALTQARELIRQTSREGVDPVLWSGAQMELLELQLASTPQLAPEEALKALDAIGDVRSSARAARLAARLLLQLGFRREAQARIADALKDNRLDAFALRCRAEVAAMSGESERAKLDRDRSPEILERRPRVLQGIGGDPQVDARHFAAVASQSQGEKRQQLSTWSARLGPPGVDEE